MASLQKVPAPVDATRPMQKAADVSIGGLVMVPKDPPSSWARGYLLTGDSGSNMYAMRSAIFSWVSMPLAPKRGMWVQGK